MNGTTLPPTTPLVAFIQQQEGDIGYYPIYDSQWNPSLIIYYTGPLIPSSTPLPPSTVPTSKVLTRVKRYRWP